jgi:Fe2+ or Zn2+ uptake regulation protein
MVSYIDSSNEFLRQRGYRMTPQRHMLLWVLQEAEGHLRIEQVVGRLRQVYPAMPLSTISRTFELLRDVGLVRENYLPGEGHTFEAVGETTHQHLLCRNCKTVLHPHMDDDALSKYREQVEQHQHSSHVVFDMLVRGYCGQCWRVIDPHE